MSCEEKIFVIPKSKVKMGETMGLICLILNLFPSSLGTLLSALIDKNGFNVNALLVWILQVVLTALFGVGWIWGIFHGYALWKVNVGNKD